MSTPSAISSKPSRVLPRDNRVLHSSWQGVSTKSIVRLSPARTILIRNYLIEQGFVEGVNFVDADDFFSMLVASAMKSYLLARAM